MQITITVQGDDQDPKVLALLRALGGDRKRRAPVAEAETEPETEAQPPARRTRRSKPAPDTSGDEDTTTSPAGDDDAATDEDEAANMVRAVELVTKMIDSGKADTVRKLLKVHGVKRVAHLNGDALEQFVNDAEADDDE